MQELINFLEPPKVIWLMIPAEPPVDSVIDDLAPQLEQGDIVIGGATHFTRIRFEELIC